MPLDHYISQVHLRNFYSPGLGNRMYATRKTNLKTFTPDASSVCRIMNGSTNAFLRKDREIEDFLKKIEPNYNTALDKLREGQIDNECIYTIAGFVAYVISCSPAAMRIQSAPLKSIVETTASLMEKQGLLPPPPVELGGASLTELLHDKTVEVQIDSKYPQAIGIASILKRVAALGNFKWEILHNDSDDSPFFTSDFPVAIEKTENPCIQNKIIPLSPNLALRIKPDHTLDRDKLNISFTKFDYHNRKISHNEIVKLNRLIVRCAEDMVFYRDNYPWILPFITKNRHYHVDVHTERQTTLTGGTLIVPTQKVVAITPTIEPTNDSTG